MSLREELIQVAAVAVAIVEDLDYGEAHAATPTGWGDTQGEAILVDVLDERWRQDNKWGPQHHTELEWLAILAEEFGEAALEIERDSQVPWELGDVLTEAQMLEHTARKALGRVFGQS